MAEYIRNLDPYDHHIVLHTYPNGQEQGYGPLIGEGSPLTGVSLQNSIDAAHERTLRWVMASRQAGKPWVVAADEQGSANLGVPPDPGYKGFTGKASQGNADSDDSRCTQVDAVGQPDGWRRRRRVLLRLSASRERSRWRKTSAAVNEAGTSAESHSSSFAPLDVPFWEMTNANGLVGNTSNDNSRYCLARPGRAVPCLCALRWRDRSRSQPGRRSVRRELVRPPKRGRAQSGVGDVSRGRHAAPSRRTASRPSRGLAGDCPSRPVAWLELGQGAPATAARNR